jgi:uncharacterized FAD-dependent dehydrogenase
MKDKNMKHIVYIGAGVSTQYGVLHLLKNGYDPSKITIIDKGNSIYDRKPEEVMTGAGGAGTWSDFKVIPSFTQGGLFYPHYCKNETLANKLSTLLYDYIVEYHPDPSKIMYTKPVEEPQFIKDSPFELRQSPCYHLGTDYGQQQVKNIFEYFDKVGVHQIYNAEVKSFSLREDHSFIWYEQDRERYEIMADKLIIGTGKSGMDLLTKLIDKYNLETVPKPGQFGVRYETDGKYFTELNKIAYDFKLYKKFGEDSARSFCTNNYAAFVAEEETYGMKSYNGHAHKDPSMQNNLTNFGIMIEARGIEDPFEFSQNLVNFFQQNGEAAYYSPTYRKPSLTDQGTTVPGYRIDLDTFKEGMGKYADYILEFIEDLNTTFGIEDNYIFYCPEVKFLTNEIVLNKTNLSLPMYPNIHLQGDAAGARGIYISAMHGLYVVNDILQSLQWDYNMEQGIGDLFG